MHHEDLTRRDHLCETKRVVLQRHHPYGWGARGLRNCAPRTFIRQWELPFFVSSRITSCISTKTFAKSASLFSRSPPPHRPSLVSLARVTGLDSISFEILCKTFIQIKFRIFQVSKIFNRINKISNRQVTVCDYVRLKKNSTKFENTFSINSRVTNSLLNVSSAASKTFCRREGPNEVEASRALICSLVCRRLLYNHSQFPFTFRHETTCRNTHWSINSNLLRTAFTIVVGIMSRRILIPSNLR